MMQMSYLVDMVGPLRTVSLHKCSSLPSLSEIVTTGKLITNHNNKSHDNFNNNVPQQHLPLL